MSRYSKERLAELLSETLSKIIREIIEIPSILVTVTRVIISSTQEHAMVYISVFPEKKSDVIMKFLDKNIYKIQHQLNEKVRLRLVPKISFKKDLGEQHAAHIEELLGSGVE